MLCLPNSVVLVLKEPRGVGTLVSVSFFKAIASLCVMGQLVLIKGIISIFLLYHSFLENSLYILSQRAAWLCPCNFPALKSPVKIWKMHVA